MPIVVDASVAVSWFLADESTPVAQTILENLGETEAIEPVLVVVRSAECPADE